MLDDQYIVVDGIRTHFLQKGKGQHLLLIHGLGGPMMWQRVTEPLARYFTVTALDLPGFGDSDCPQELYSPRRHSEFIAHVLDAMGIQRVVLIGISYGGQIAATFALSYRHRVEKLVLINSTGLLSDHGLLTNKIIRTLVFAVAKHIVLRSELLTCLIGRLSFYHIDSRPEDFCAKFHHHMMQDGKRDAWLNGLFNVFTEEHQFRIVLSSLQVPTMIIAAERDITVPPQLATEFSRLIHNSEIRTFPECAHSLPLEKPSDLCEAITQFAYSPVNKDTRTLQHSTRETP
ncbi:MAG: alpha/beta hydrolase [Ignavibacteria bacterium]|nr:alpha/beta hydrolase [Ignavibacteria bacterium]